MKRNIIKLSLSDTSKFPRVKPRSHRFSRVAVFTAISVSAILFAACAPRVQSTYPTEVTDKNAPTAEQSVSDNSGGTDVDTDITATTTDPFQTLPSKPYVPVKVPQDVHDDLLAAQGIMNTSLMRQLYMAGAEQGNIAVSPFSLYVPLSMLGNAVSDPDILEKYNYQLCYYNFDENSRNFGVAESNLYEKAQINRLTRSGDSLFLTANSLWLSDKLKNVENDLKFKLKDNFNAEMFVRDLPSSVDTVNKWAGEKTLGKIPDIVSEINPAAQAIVVNATYFKGKWQYPFKKDKTHRDIFNNADKTAVETDFMVSPPQLFGYLNENGVQAVELPYGGDGRFAMRVFTGDNLDAVNEYVAAVGYIEDVSSAFTYHDEVVVTLPKFKVETTMELLGTLDKIGFGFALEDGAFGKLGGGKIDEVIQKVYIGVNEDGTEAAAVTGITMTNSAMVKPSPIQVKFDKPFIYGIYDMEDNLPLFYGVYRQAGS